jgi:hypothetical protein
MTMSAVSVHDDNDLFEESEQAAKGAARQWIRATLRETFLQALKKVWIVSVSSDYPGIDEDYTVEVPTEGFQQCLSFVEEVANAWKTKLMEAQHERVAGWVDEVFSNGRSNLWTEGIASHHAPSPSPGSAVQDADSQNLPGDTDTQPRKTIDSSETIIPYCKLRRLGRKTFLEGKLPENPLPLFQEMGRRGESYWPLDWKLIEAAANREKQKRKSTKQPTDDEQGETVDNPAMLPPAKRQKVEDSIGRPPADISSMIASSESLSKKEKESLRDQFMHPNPSESAKVPPLVLFGALQKVSQINYSKRHRDEWTDRKNRLGRNAATAERLFPNKIESNDSVRSYRSKVLKTRDRNDDNIHCFDLDLGWSLMEVTGPGGEGQKRLCAFSSVEIRLNDEEDVAKESNN